MNEIEENIRSVRASLPPAVELVAVSKTHPVEAIREAYRAGPARLRGKQSAGDVCQATRTTRGYPLALDRAFAEQPR